MFTTNRIMDIDLHPTPRLTLRCWHDAETGERCATVLRDPAPSDPPELVEAETLYDGPERSLLARIRGSAPIGRGVSDRLDAMERDALGRLLEARAFLAPRLIRSPDELLAGAVELRRLAPEVAASEFGDGSRASWRFDGLLSGAIEYLEAAELEAAELDALLETLAGAVAQVSGNWAAAVKDRVREGREARTCAPSLSAQGWEARINLAEAREAR